MDGAVPAPGLRHRLILPLSPTETGSPYHIPVLAAPAIDLLLTDPDGVYVDGTVGGGGHSRLIFERLSANGLLIGCDRDPDAIREARSALPPSATLLQGPFSSLEQMVRPHLRDGVTGILLDLGVSSFQLDTAGRGFSHRFSGPLDLRMDPGSGETASDLLSQLEPGDLIRLLRDYGEESQAPRIAKAIVRERERAPITTTDRLADVISRAVPATRVKSLARVFQALRIAVNHELEELEAVLPAAWSLLAPGGRLVVISYHSLEDRIVKGYLRSQSQTPHDPVGLPGVFIEKPAGRLLTRKPIVPSQAETLQNPRARSARLRAIEKLA